MHCDIICSVSLSIWANQTFSRNSILHFTTSWCPSRAILIVACCILFVSGMTMRDPLNNIPSDDKLSSSRTLKFGLIFASFCDLCKSLFCMCCITVCNTESDSVADRISAAVKDFGIVLSTKKFFSDGLRTIIGVSCTGVWVSADPISWIIATWSETNKKLYGWSRNLQRSVHAESLALGDPSRTSRGRWSEIKSKLWAPNRNLCHFSHPHTAARASR